MALEIKLRPRKQVGSNDSREVAVFISLDGQQFQSSGTVTMRRAELAELYQTRQLSATPSAENQDIVLSTEVP